MKDTACVLFTEALEKSTPEVLLDQEITIQHHDITIGPQKWDKENFNSVYIIAIGKAAEPMAAKLVELFSVDTERVLCIAPDSKNQEKSYTIYASHPIPDEKSERAGKRLVEFIERIPPKSTVLFAISGGTSALVCQPAQGVAVRDISKVNEQLIQSGASIDEINCVRKHLSKIKGGQLLRYFNADIKLIDLVISDVPNDDLAIIGSGLTIPDSTTFQDVCDILMSYELWDKLPEAVRSHIKKGSERSASETLKPGEDPVKNHYSYIIGSAQKFAQTVAEEVGNRGLKSWVADTPFNQSAAEVAEMIFEKIVELSQKNDQKQALIFYGESTVEVTCDGKGGRNQELALHGALKIAGMENVYWLSAGTDGVDGPTDAAGAIVDGNTISKAKEKGIDPAEFLRNNDSYNFHEQMDTLLKTGPTGNNMMDVVLVLIGSMKSFSN